MSIDPSFPVSTSANDSQALPGEISSRGGVSSSQLSRSEQDQWKKLRKRVQKRASETAPSKVFGPSAKAGCVYRWGIANAIGGPCSPLVDILSRLAVDERISKKQYEQIDFSLVTESFCDQPLAANESAVDHTLSILWAAAMPGLIDRMETRLWWDLLGKLQHLCERFRLSDDESSPAKLILAGELGLTLAWRLADLPSCHRLREPSVRAIKEWFKGEDASIAAAVQGAATARLNLASLVRCDDLLKATTKRRLSKRQRAIAADLATWVGGLTNAGGASVFLPTTIDAPAVKTKHRYLLDDDASLLAQATRFDPETLQPAMQAALGVTQTGGRLAWEVCLPESLIHCDNAKLAVLMPEWDVRRGRTVIDYSQEDCRFEVHAGRTIVFRGNWEVMLNIDGEEQSPKGPWESTCEFSDDDVHYLEVEQEWTGGVILQRQFLVVRDDRCVLLCDNVLADNADPQASHDDGKPSPQNDSHSLPFIEYTSRIPMTPETVVDPEKETREFYFREPPIKSTGKKKASGKKTAKPGKARMLAIPLSASEWRVGPTPCKMETSQDGHLVLNSTARGNLCVPLWLDTMPRRFRRKRTWRPLTIADDRQLVSPDKAVAYRIQMGSEHWLMYRSLADSCVRTFLGKHLIADFFAARFHPEDGGMEELVTVENDDDS